MTGPFPPFVPFVTLLMAPSASINACVVYHLSEQTAWPPRQQTVLLQEGEDHFSGLGTSHRAVDQNGENLRARVIHHKAGIQKPMGKHQFGPAMAGGRTVLLRDGRRGASQAQRRPGPPCAEEGGRRRAGSRGTASVLLQLPVLGLRLPELEGAKHSPGRVGDRPLGGASQPPCSRNSDDGPFANHYGIALPGFSGRKLDSLPPIRRSLSSAARVSLQGEHPARHQQNRRGGECLYGKSYKNATFPWGETCYMRF